MNMSNMPAAADVRDEISAIDLIARVWAGKFIVLACMALGLLVGAVYLHVTTPVYTAELKVTPAQSTGGISGSIGELGGLAALAGISLGSSSSAAATPFDLYIDTLSSRELADELAREPRILRTIFAAEWDEQEQRWTQPVSAFATAAKPVASLLGLRWASWQGPDGARLQAHLARNIIVSRDPKEPITRVSYKHADPEFAVHLLGRIDRLADRHVRRDSLTRAVEYSRYLSGRLGSVLVAEQREALAQILSDQEKSIMMASSNIPFASILVQQPVASTEPTDPNGIVTLALSLVAGLFLGILWVLADVGALARRIRSRLPRPQSEP